MEKGLFLIKCKFTAENVILTQPQLRLGGFQTFLTVAYWNHATLNKSERIITVYVIKLKCWALHCHWHNKALTSDIINVISKTFFTESSKILHLKGHKSAMNEILKYTYIVFLNNVNLKIIMRVASTVFLLKKETLNGLFWGTIKHNLNTRWMITTQNFLYWIFPFIYF